MIAVSLRLRISLVVVILLAVVIAAVMAVMYHEMEESLLDHVDSSLMTKAQGMVAVMRDMESERRSDLEAEVRSIAGAEGDSRAAPYRIWIAGRQEDIFASDPPTSQRARWLSDVPRPPESGMPPAPVNIGPARSRHRGIWLRGRTTKGTDFNVVIAEPSEHAYHELDEFRDLLLVVGGSVTLGTGIFVYAVVLWGLWPIGRVAARLAKVTHRDMGAQRLQTMKAPPELRPFVRSTADMLSRLAEAMERQKEFAANAAHELRTPLAVAKSTLQAAEVSHHSERELRRDIAEALEDMGRMERLMEQLLLLARMDAEEPGAEFVDVSLPELLTEVAGASPSEAGCIVVDPGADVTVPGNRDQLFRLFSNLIDNAVQYGPAGSPVTVTITPLEPDRVVVCVHDEGGRIAPEALPRLFDRFYRVDPSRSQATGGTGLGLAIAREIAVRHGGDIRIESCPEEGTSVRVSLPRAR
jgi:signal transduction histidine kinase